MSRALKTNLAIFVSVNVLLLLVWAGSTVAGVRLHTHLWPWPVLMALWAGRIALSSRPRHEKVIPEDQIQREIRKIS